MGLEHGLAHRIGRHHSRQEATEADLQEKKSAQVQAQESETKQEASADYGRAKESFRKIVMCSRI